MAKKQKNKKIILVGKGLTVSAVQAYVSTAYEVRMLEDDIYCVLGENCRFATLDLLPLIAKIKPLDGVPMIQGYGDDEAGDE